MGRSRAEPKGTPRAAQTRVGISQNGFEASVRAGHKLVDRDDLADSDLAVQMREPLVAVGDRLDADPSPQLPRIELEEHKISPPAVGGVRDQLDLLRKRQVDEAHILNAPSKRRFAVEPAESSPFPIGLKRDVKQTSHPSIIPDPARPLIL